MTTESKDRVALRQVHARLFARMHTDHSGDVEAHRIASAALAQPDPAHELAEALRAILSHPRSNGSTLALMPREVAIARAALAKWESA